MSKKIKVDDHDRKISIVKQRESMKRADLLEFLKTQGFKPKNDIRYFQTLLRKLKMQNKEIVCIEDGKGYETDSEGNFQVVKNWKYEMREKE